jgi:beta-glucanase (GH16 family)
MTVGDGMPDPTARMRTLARLVVSIFGLLFALGASDQNPSFQAGAALDISQYTLTFEDAFSSLSVAGKPGSGARWYAHTPWAGDFGEARFIDPTPDGPFVTGAGGLSIVARKTADGRWTSGLISSRDRDGPDGRGFSQAFGYFEMKAKLPEGKGLWPAFWLIGVDKSHSAAEIDVMEDYGAFPGYYHSVAHIWRGEKNSWAQDFLIPVPPGSLYSQFNLFGVSIESHLTRFYLNRHIVAAMTTPPEYRQPFYILANLALGGASHPDALPSPQSMQIAYIRAYRRRDGGDSAS